MDSSLPVCDGPFGKLCHSFSECLLSMASHGFCEAEEQRIYWLTFRPGELEHSMKTSTSTLAIAMRMNLASSGSPCETHKGTKRRRTRQTTRPCFMVAGDGQQRRSTGQGQPKGDCCGKFACVPKCMPGPKFISCVITCSFSWK